MKRLTNRKEWKQQVFMNHSLMKPKIILGITAIVAVIVIVTI